MRVYRISLLPRGQGRPRTDARVPYAKLRGALMPQWFKRPGSLDAAVRAVLGALKGSATIHETTEDEVWKTRARAMLTRQADGVEPLTGPLQIRIVAAWPLPKSKRRVRSPVPATFKASKPDFDNVEKIICDAATGVLWHDDAQIARCSTELLLAPQEMPGGVLLFVDRLDDRDAVAAYADFCRHAGVKTTPLGLEEIDR